MTTGVVTSSFQNLQLDAGVFLTNFDPSTYQTLDALKTAVATAIADDTKCIGATRGGGTFTATPTTHEVEADGKRYLFKGSTRVDSWEIKLTTTLLEVTPANFMKALGSGTKTGTTVTKITINTELQDNAYIENLCWVGDMSNGGMVCIVLANALNTSGINLTFADKGEGTLPVEFQAVQDSVEDVNVAPATVYFFNPAA